MTLVVDHFGADDTSIRLEPGRLNVVLGRNGAGKTALCRVVAGLDEPGAVTVRHGERDLTRLDARRRDVGLVFGEFVNYPSLTVAQNIAAPLRAAGLGAAQRDARVREFAARVGLTDHLDRLPEALSGGQQQRVALARALAKRPSILLLDEPLANLDYKLREAMQGELRDLLSGGDVTVVYTTSDPREALELGDEIVLLVAGSPVQQGAPLDLLRTPTNVDAADLLCDPGINRTAARIDGDALVLGAGPRLPRPARVPDAPALVAAVRPDHLRRAGEDPRAVTLDARVQISETNGSDTWLHVEVGCDDWVAHLDGLDAARPGDAIALAVRAEDVLLFPASAAAKRAVTAS